MSFQLATIDLSVATQPLTIQVPSNLQLNQIGWIEFLNESPFKVNFNSGSFNVPITAWQDYPLHISENQKSYGTLSLPLQISWQLLTNIENVPTQLDIVFYSLGETPSATSPVSLTRQVATTVANATSVTNTGFPIGNLVVFAVPSGDPDQNTGALKLFNDGTAVFGDVHTTPLVTIFGAGGGDVQFSNSSMVMNNASSTEVFGVDSSGNLTGANGKTEITFGAGNETHIANLAGSDIAFFSPLATELMRLVNDGSMKILCKQQTFNGATGGTLLFYEIITGSNFKMCLLIKNNWNSPVATNQNITLAHPFAGVVQFQTGAIGNSSLFLRAGGSNMFVNVVTTLAFAGGTLTGSSASAFGGASIGTANGAMDTIQVLGLGSANFGSAFFWGQ